MTCCTHHKAREREKSLDEHQSPFLTRNWSLGTRLVWTADPTWAMFTFPLVCTVHTTVRYSYSTGTGIYGSKPPKSERAAQGQGLFTLPYIPGNRAITIIISHLWLATNHEQSTHARRHHSNRGYKLETTAGVNETAEIFTCSPTILACTLGPAVL